MNFKKIIKYLICLVPWFLSSIIIRDYSYYKQINLPFFAPPSWVFPVVWGVLYILIAYSIFKVFKESEKSYKLSLLINYILNQLYSFTFFILKNNFLAFVNSLAVLVSTLYLYYETKQLDNKSSKLLILYIIWDIFATLLSLTVIFLN